MIYGNKHAQDIFQKFSQQIQNNKIDSGFFIISGPKNIGKKTLIRQLVSESGIFTQDLLFIEDPQNENGKYHQIKVEVDEKDRFLEINGKTFIDFGAREIVDFVSKTPSGNFKFVFIENIERMNKNTANAMLKTLEEPPSNTFIFATCSNKHKLLDTIISRGTLINMNELSWEEFQNFLQNNFPDLPLQKSELLFAVSSGRIGLAQKLLNENSELLEQIETFLKSEEFDDGIFNRFSLFKELINSGKINIFLDGLIFYYTYSNNFQQTKKLIDIKNKALANVNIENLLFNYLIS